MDKQIITRFLELKVTGQRFSMTPEEKAQKDARLISYLNYIIDNNIVVEFEDIGFCYWNISDNYALLRDADSLKRNHYAFCDFIKSSDSCYLYWAVCDATQRITLENGGYSDFWWGIYRDAVEQNSDSKNFFSEFCTHRTAFYKNPILPHTQSNVEYARKKFEKFLQKTENVPEYKFYKIIYLSLASRYFQFDKQKLSGICTAFCDDLSYPEINNDFLIGEWRNFSVPFSKHKQAVVAINSSINAFIYNGEIKIAENIYKNARDMGFPRNSYIETRLDNINCL